MSVFNPKTPPVPCSSEKSVNGPSFNEQGVPDHLRSIHVTTWGAFFRDGQDGLIYSGGTEVYIHYVDPENFTLVDFFKAMHTMKVALYLPEKVWFNKWAKHWPEALHAIGGEEDLVDMWDDCDQNGVLEAHVFTQHVDYILDKSVWPWEMTYRCPSEVPKVDDTVDMRGVHMVALENQIEDQKLLGIQQIAHDEMIGRRWYVSTKSKPMRVYETSKDLNDNEIGYSRPCKKMQRSFVIEDVYTPKDWRVQLGLEPAIPKNFILDENAVTRSIWRNNGVRK